MPDQKKKTILMKTDSFHTVEKPKRMIRRRGLGIGGEIASFERSGNPPIFFDWKAAYSKGAGKGSESKALRENIRAKRGPRLSFAIKF